MKQFIYIFIMIMGFNSYAESLVIEATIFPWVSDCKDPSRCNIPTASNPSFKINLYIKELYQPQTGDVFQKEFKVTENRSGVLKAFSVFPDESTNIPPYIQFQLTQKLPEYLLCSHSVKLRMPMSVPPLICASSHNGINVGYTITFKQIEN